MRPTLQSPGPGPAADSQAHTTSPSLRREILVAAVFILFSSLSYFLIEYDRLRTMDVGLEAWVQGILAGIVPAPIQYRIAMPLLAHWFEVCARLRVNQSLPLIEAVAYACTLALLYVLFRASPEVQRAGPARRFAMLGFFLAAVQLPVLWIFPWERPETLPTAAYLAATVVLIVRRNRMPFAAVALLIALLSAAQALIRADVSVMAGVAILLAAALAIPFPFRRSQVAILGLLCALVGGATQVYLERVAYPSAAYPADTPKVQLLFNLSPSFAPLHIPIFLTALLPLGFSVLLLRRFRLPFDSSDKLVLLLCLVYLPLWITTGLMAEVRIFVPFLLLASPTIARLWTSFLLHQDNEAAAA